MGASANAAPNLLPALSRGASMRTVAIALAALALVPIGALIAWGWRAEQGNMLRGAAENLAQAKELIDAGQRRSIEGTNQLLGAIAEAPAVIGANWEVCNAYLRRVGKRFPAYLSLSVSDLEGNIVCTSLPVPVTKISIRDTPNFTLAQQAPSFSVGVYTVGRISAAPVVPYSMPVHGPGGERVAIVFASMNLRGLQQRLGALNLPDGVGAIVTDAAGVVLADATDPRYQGLPAKNSMLADTLAKGYTGALETTDAQGRGTQHLIRAHQLPGGGKLMTVTSSSQLEQVAPVIQRLGWITFAVLAVLTLYAALLWYLARRWIFKPLRLVTHDMKLIAAGRYEGVDKVRHGFVREIEALRKDLDGMWHSLARRARERDNAQGAIVQAQNAASKARDEMWAVLNAMNEGFMVLNKDWSIKFCNVLGGELVLKEPAELIGQNFWALFPAATADGKRRKCELEIAQGKPYTFEEFHSHHKRWLELRFFVPDGDIGVFMLDSTEHWKMLDEMVEREQRYRELFDANPSPMVIVDAETYAYLAVNTAALKRYGYSNEEFLLLSPQDLAPREDRAALRLQMQQHAATGAGVDEPRIARHVTSSGEIMLVEVVRYPIIFNGRPALVATSTEVTRRERVEATLRTELAVQKKKQGNVVATLSAYAHMVRAYGQLLGREVRPMLQRVARLGTLSELPDSPPEVRNYVATLLGQTRVMDRLLREVLRLADISRAPFGVQSFDLAPLAAHVVAELRASDPKREVSVDIQASMPCHGDPALVRTLLEAVLENAWKFTAASRGAWIRVGMSHKGAPAIPTYSVADNGCGFNAADHDRIFLPLERAHGEGEFHGYGIGLAVARSVVARHGGRIWGESRPGQGATFFFELEPPLQPAGAFVREVVIDSPPSEPDDDDAQTTRGQPLAV